VVETLTPIYLYLDLLVILFPLLLSFDKKVAYVKKWKYLFPAIFISGCFFVVWDMIFTHMNVWSFNPNYLVGINIGNLPLEEVLFFLVVPFSCVFVYEVLIAYLKTTISNETALKINLLFLIFFIFFGLYFNNKIYTLFQCLFLVILMVLHQKFFKANYLGWFYLTFAICLVPFLLMNGYLTALPIVIYNDYFNSGIRIGTIPIEDSFYCLLLLLLNITVYEYLKRKY
jgi:lycopene cyclase domain-containing protein